MKAYISYSLTTSDEFFVTLLSLFLKDENILSVIGQTPSNDKDLSIEVKKQIEESNLFVGLIFNESNSVSSVINEWQYSSSVNIPNLLLIEDGIELNDIDEKNYIRFNRNSSHKIINEINSRTVKTNPNYTFWLFVGNPLKLSIERAFQLENKRASFVVSGRLRLIEDRLLGLDSAAFQNLCDIYLTSREQQPLASINRTGSQFGKQKTVKGTPDSFFRLSDGSLYFVEYTTQSGSVVKKIKEDIDKCLDPSFTGVPADQIYKIIVCFNARINVEEENKIIKYANSKDIRVELIGLDWLALEIYSKYLIIAKDILGISLDTGQLLPIQEFIKGYNNKAGQLSTPLDNIFLHRKDELIQIEDILSDEDLLIISGFPGVGKTKIALEAVNNFLDENPEYTAIAVSKNDQDISDDLKIYLLDNQKYILLIDDANRQLINFKQILGIFKQKSKRQIKLIITVREYALRDILNECFEFSHQILPLNKFSDEEITQLISVSPFEIKNSKYQKKIVQIADGNARIAVMASRLAQQEQVGFLYGEGERIYELYDYYFKTFIKDFAIFDDKTLLKTLGIISFFYTIDKSNKHLLETIFEVFDIDYYTFNEAIDELEKRELVEVSFSNVKVSEQIMATYFFYKVFIKDEILSFRTLLFTFFPKWEKRFSDTIIPSNNSFGYESVFSKINVILDEYLYSIYLEEDKVLEFLSLFWFYKREEVLNYFYKKVKELPESDTQTYPSKYETNDFVFERDKTLDMLSNLFRDYTESFNTSLELAFEYCRKKPNSLPELIRRMKENLLFDEDDSHNDFQRQIELFDLLIKGLNEMKPHYIEAFFAITNIFLSHHFRISKGGRKNTVSFYQYPLPFYEVTKEFRQKVWITLFDNFERYPDKVLVILNKFSFGYLDPIVEISEFDLTFILPFIETRLNPTDFEHIYFVRDFTEKIKRSKVKDKTYLSLNSKFNSSEYEYFKKMDWNTLRGKQDYDFKNHEQFRILKEKDVRSSFVFSTTEDFKPLHHIIEKMLLHNEKDITGVYQSLDIILEENFSRNHSLGFQLLKSIFENYPKGLSPLYKGIKIIVATSVDWALKLWELIKEWKHEYKLYWQLSFFDCLPSEFVNRFYTQELIESIKSLNVACYLQFDSFEKFSVIDNNIILNILEIVTKKIENEELRIKLSYHFFENYSEIIFPNFDLLSKAYLQQDEMDESFDYERDGLKLLIKLSPNFLLDFFKNIFSTNKKFNHKDISHNRLTFIWDLENQHLLIESVSNIILENSRSFGMSNHPLSIFFNNLTNEQKLKAKSFLFDYISKYCTYRNRMESIFSVIRNSMNDVFEESLLHYLDLNSNIEDFERIYWIGHGGTYRGDVIVADIRTKDWENILSIVNKSKKSLELIEIKTFLKQQITFQIKSAEEERKRKFINSDGW